MSPSTELFIWWDPICTTSNDSTLPRWTRAWCFQTYTVDTSTVYVRALADEFCPGLLSPWAWHPAPYVHLGERIKCCIVMYHHCCLETVLCIRTVWQTPFATLSRALLRVWVCLRPSNREERQPRYFPIDTQYSTETILDFVLWGRASWKRSSISQFDRSSTRTYSVVNSKSPHLKQASVAAW